MMMIHSDDNIENKPSYSIFNLEKIYKIYLNQH